MTAPCPIDLHIDLIGAAPPGLIRDMAKRNRRDIGGVFAPDGGYAFDGYPEFRRVHAAVASVPRSPEDHHRLTLEVLERAAEGGVIYAELSLTPDAPGDLSAWRERVDAVREAAEARAGIVARGLVTCLRHDGPDRARQAARCAAETAGAFVAGFGLSGDETVGTPRDFSYAFDMAREAGLGLFADAGQRRGPEALRDTLRDLRVDRIGHGGRAVEDLALVDTLAEGGTVLVARPAMDIALGLVPDWRAHPVGRLFERGVKVTIATGCEAFRGASMREQCDRLADAFDWDAGVFATLGRTALDAAFCDADTRTLVRKRLEDRDD